MTSGARWTTGKSGSAVNLDGVNDYVQVGAQSKVAMTRTASFSAWIYRTGPGSADFDPTELTMSEYLIHRRIALKPHHQPTGKTRHTQGSLIPEGVVRGAELPTPCKLLIAQLSLDEGYYLLYLDKAGNEITDTYHDSLEEALAQAKWEFQVEPTEWETV